MKRNIILMALLVFTLILCLCGCKKSVDSSEIIFEDMTLELPSADWYYGENENQYESENCSFTLIQTDEWDYREYDRSFEFFDYEEYDPGGYPSCNFMYIDGYVTEFYSDEDGMILMIDYYRDFDESSRISYLIDADYIEDKKVGKEDFKEILRSIKFTESGNEPTIGMFWQDAISDLKPELEDGSTHDVMVMGRVSEVTHATGQNGKPYYIDLGGKYPDPDRVTGVIWEEYQDGIDDDELFEIDDHFAVLLGEAYLYDNIVNIRITDGRHVKPIYRVDDL